MDIVQVVRELRTTAHPKPLYHLPRDALQSEQTPRAFAGEEPVIRASLAGAPAYLENSRTAADAPVHFALSP